MVEDDRQLSGAMEEQIKEIAQKSLQNCSNNEQFVHLFPELKQEIDGKLRSNLKRCGVFETNYVKKRKLM